MGQYVGRRSNEPNKKRRVPLTSWLLILLAVFSLTIGSVVAYLSASTNPAVNSFIADESLDPTISETFDGNTKTDVKVNVGNPGYAVYVRAAVVVTWKSGDDGTVFGQIPKLNEDYTITFNSTDWFKGSDGYYYHKASVNSGGETAVLIESCTPVNGKAPAGYGLNVEIIAQTIQALGTTDDDHPAVTDAWGITVSEGKLKQ